jgi:hypothetical protein
MVAITDEINSNDDSSQTKKIIHWLGDERAGEFSILKENLKDYLLNLVDVPTEFLSKEDFVDHEIVSSRMKCFVSKCPLFN